MGLTVEEFAARCDWAAVRRAMAERRDELQGTIGQLRSDVETRSRPRQAEVERLEALAANVALLDWQLQMVDRRLLLRRALELGMLEHLLAAEGA